MQILMGVFKLGSIIKFMPYPIIVGFTGGIAITIFSTQMNDLFGLGISNVPANFIDKWACYFQNISNINWWALLIGVLSILIIVLTPKISKKIPGSLLAIIVMTALTWVLKKYAGIDSIKTIGDLYELPSGLPSFRMPALAEGETLFSTAQKVLPAAFTIAMLGAIESLLSAMVADGVISDKHCFYQYIAFLLGDDHMLSSLESIELQKEGGSRSRSTGYQLPPLYEKMLQTAATNPANLKEIDYLLKAVSDDGVIPEHFGQMYQTFRKVVKLDD